VGPHRGGSWLVTGGSTGRVGSYGLDEGGARGKPGFQFSRETLELDGTCFVLSEECQQPGEVVSGCNLTDREGVFERSHPAARTSELL